MTDLEDPIEKSIGRFGKYQTWILILLSIGRLPTEFQFVNVVFILPSVDFVCADGDYNNTLNVCPCENPIFDNSTFTNTITTTWSLICDRRHLASLAQSMLQIGILAGSIIFGYISDRYGRRIAVVLTLSIEVFAVAISAVVPEFWLFMICRFLIGVAIGGTILCCYVLLIELAGKTFRPYLLGLIEISYITGYLLLPVIAFYIRDWRWLQLATSVPFVFVLVYFWLIPESPRWLITVGRRKEAIVILTNIAKRNNRPTEGIEDWVNKFDVQPEKESKQSATYLDLFKTPKMRSYSIIMAMVWLCCAHTFFGVNQYIGRLGGNIYINVIISAASLAPAIFLCTFVNLYFKRKICVIAFFVTAGSSLLLLTFISNERARLAFAIIGQMCTYSAFTSIYLYSSEIFPTVIRNSAMGFASVCARLGGFIAPFVVDIGVDWISILLFSSLALLAAILCLFLPETKGTVLFNSIDQIENFNEINEKK